MSAVAFPARRACLGATWRAAWLAAALCAAAARCAAAAAMPGAAAPADVPPAAAASAVDGSEDIRDIRGPKAVPGSWLLPLLISGGIVLALVYAVWRWRRRPARVRDLLPFERALERLDGIRALMNPSNARAFGIAASEIVRTYIEQRFAVIATQRTTEEFLKELAGGPDESLARHRSLLAEFLQQCDFVKFAGASLTLQNMESLLQSARSFVLETGRPAAT